MTDEADPADVERAMDRVDHTDLESPDANQPEILLEHTYVEHDDRPDELGVTPIDMEPGIMTQWITIDAEDACDLDEWR